MRSVPPLFFYDILKKEKATKKFKILATKFYEDIGLKTSASIAELEKCYRVYEYCVEKAIKAQKLKTKELHIKEGQAIFWAAKMLQGGIRMKN